MYLATRPRPESANEDYVNAAISSFSARAVLLDGAGGPPELDTGCDHGTPWYVNELGDRAMFHARRPKTALSTALAEAIDEVAQMHGVYCDLNNPGTPSSTVVMARRASGRVEYLVLGDSTFVAEFVDGHIETVTDRRIDQVGADLYAAMAALPTGTDEHQAARIAFVQNQRRMRNRPGGYPIASNNPEAAYQARMGAYPEEQVRRIGLFSDGAARFVDFGLGSWTQALDTLNEDGPDRLFDQVRAAEADDPAGARWPRAKQYDDVGAVYMDLSRA